MGFVGNGGGFKELVNILDAVMVNILWESTRSNTFRPQRINAHVLCNRMRKPLSTSDFEMHFSKLHIHFHYRSFVFFHGRQKYTSKCYRNFQNAGLKIPCTSLTSLI